MEQFDSWFNQWWHDYKGDLPTIRMACKMAWKAALANQERSNLRSSRLPTDHIEHTNC